MNKQADRRQEIKKLDEEYAAEVKKIRNKYADYKVRGFDGFPGNAELRELDNKYKEKYFAIVEKYNG